MIRSSFLIMPFTIVEAPHNMPGTLPILIAIIPYIIKKENRIWFEKCDFSLQWQVKAFS
jgi:hypothetical protein